MPASYISFYSVNINEAFPCFLGHANRHLALSDFLDSDDPAALVSSSVRDDSHKHETGQVFEF